MRSSRVTSFSSFLAIALQFLPPSAHAAEITSNSAGSAVFTPGVSLSDSFDGDGIYADRYQIRGEIAADASVTETVGALTINGGTYDPLNPADALILGDNRVIYPSETTSFTVKIKMAVHPSSTGSFQGGLVLLRHAGQGSNVLLAGIMQNDNGAGGISRYGVSYWDSANVAPVNLSDGQFVEVVLEYSAGAIVASIFELGFSSTYFLDFQDGFSIGMLVSAFQGPTLSRGVFTFSELQSDLVSDVYTVSNTPLSYNGVLYSQVPPGSLGSEATVWYNPPSLSPLVITVPGTFLTMDGNENVHAYLVTRLGLKHTIYSTYPVSVIEQILGSDGTIDAVYENCWLAKGFGNDYVWNLNVGPIVDTILPQTALAGDTVTISGSSFGATQETGRVFMRIRSTPLSTFSIRSFALAAPAEIDLTITMWSDSEVVASVPSDVAAGDYDIVVKVRNIESNLVAFAVMPGDPVIDYVLPTNVQPGDTVTVIGNNFGGTQGLSALYAEGLALEITSWSLTMIEAIIPIDFPLGRYALNVQVGDRQSNVAYVSVSPVIDSLSPTVGIARTVVNVSGAGLYGGNLSGFMVGDKFISNTGISWSGTNASFMIPNDIGAGNFVVYAVINGVASNMLPLDVMPGAINVRDLGQGILSIEGYNLGESQNDSLVFLNDIQVEVKSWKSQEIIASVPLSIVAGQYQASVLVGGYSATDSQHLISVRPEIASITPEISTVGQQIEVTGSHFGAIQSGPISFQKQSMPVEFWSETLIRFRIAGTGLREGSNSFTVNVNGQIATGAFSLQNGPYITNAQTEAAPGDTVTITGINFGASGFVKFGKTILSPLSWSPSQVQFVVPNVTKTTSTALSLNVGSLSSNSVNLRVYVSPYIVSITPSVGVAGTVATLRGLNFGSDQGTSLLYFGGNPLIPDTWDDTVVSFTVPNVPMTRDQDVYLVINSIKSNLVSISPILDIRAASVSVATAGDLITLTGVGLSSVSANIQGVPLVVQLLSSTQVMVQVPATAGAGKTGITLVSADGRFSDTEPLDIFPTITAIQPSWDTAGMYVEVLATNILRNSIASLSLNGNIVKGIKTYDGWATFRVPGDIVAGIQQAVLSVNDQKSNAFAFSIAPTLSMVSPSTIGLGLMFDIHGLNFGDTQGLSEVFLGDQLAVPAFWSMQQIRVRVPLTTPMGSQPVFVRVGGMDTRTVNVNVTPTILSMAPSSGSGGQNVMLQGFGFGEFVAGSQVLIGGLPTQVINWTDRSIQIMVTDTLPAGLHSLTVAAGTFHSTVNSFSVFPRLDSVSESIATEGMELIISGTNFGPDTKVMIGLLPLPIISLQPLSIRARVTAEVPLGTQSLVVESGGFRSAIAKSIVIKALGGSALLVPAGSTFVVRPSYPILTTVQSQASDGTIVPAGSPTGERELLSKSV